MSRLLSSDCSISGCGPHQGCQCETKEMGYGMRCYCVETEEEFIFCVEDVEPGCEENIQAAWYEKVGCKYMKTYPSTICDKECLKENFPRLGESMFRGEGDWRRALDLLARKCSDENVDWYITGSVSESVLGVEIAPHDIDVVSHVKDFFRLKEIFRDYMVEPFVDNQDTWVVRYFGRICIDGVMIDIVADDSRNAENHAYISVCWNGWTLKVEPIEERHRIELERGRPDRVNAIEEYLKSQGE